MGEGVESLPSNGVKGWGVSGELLLTILTILDQN